MTPLAWLRCSSCVSHLVGRCGVATGGEPGGGGDGRAARASGLEAWSSRSS